MNEEQPKHVSRNLVFIVCAAISALSIGIIIWVIVAFLNKPVLNDDFFVSDETKTTISLTPSNPTSGNPTHQTYVVYDYDGNDVIGMKTYFEYQSAEAAATAYESLKSQPEFKNAELSDKYIIVTADESQFKGLTASDVRQQAEAIRQYNESLNPTSSESTETSEEPVEEVPEE